jgi:fibronectin-binding autotransporter adhesin
MIDQRKTFLRRLVARQVMSAAFLLAGFICSTGTVFATITWSGGTNTVLAGTTLHDTSIVISGNGTNTVQGAAGPPSNANPGVLQLDSGGVDGLEITGSTLTLNSDASSPGKLALMGNLVSHAASVTSFIISGGVAAVPGKIDSSGGTRIYTVESGTVPGNGPDLSISATITNSGVRKEGPGILALSGNNTYTGGTSIGTLGGPNAGKLYINSATAIGKGPLTISADGASIDNTSGAPITLSNNNPVNVFGNGLTFVGTNDLNLGTGLFVIDVAPSRTVSVTNASATLTIGGIIGDNGHNVALVKDGAGTLLLNGHGIYGGGTSVNGGVLDLASTAQTGAGAVSVGANGTLIADGKVNGNVSVSGILMGTGTIDGSLVINNGGLAEIINGTLTVNGAITNNGTFVLKHGAAVTSGSGFVNNATLDLITAGSTPANLTNNGTIIDSSVVMAKTASRTGTTMTVTINSYTGHTYQLQKSTTTPDNTSFTTNVGSAQQGTTGMVLTFTDSSASGTQSFYRIAVDS